MTQKPIAQKKLEGTYIKCRDADREKAESALSEKKLAFPPDARLRAPKCLTTREGRAYWRNLTQMLIALQVLSPADLPQVEELCVLLEKRNEARDIFLSVSPLDEEYDRLMKAYLKLCAQFDALAKNYYISPAARSKLALDMLNVKKTANEVKAQDQDNAILALLERRQGGG